MKKLLLGSAAAMLLGGAAQAADLSVAEPIDYVRVCDAFGNTYWYSPGTDTCLSITGYVRLDTRIGAGIAGATATSAAGNWLFNTKAALTVQARSMTEWGPLVGFMRMAGQSNNSAVGPGGTPAGAASPIHNVALEEYYGSLGNLLFGFTESTYQYGYNVPHFRVINNFGQLRLGNVDQVRFGFAAGGWGVAVAAEDPRDMALATNTATMAFPDIAARLTGSMGIVSAQLSAAYGARTVYNTWGVQLGANVDLSQIAAGDALKVAFALGNSPERVSGALADAGPGTYWTAQASFVHVLNAQWAAAVYGSYSRSGPAANAAWQASFIAQFTPVTNFTISGELAYVVAQGAAAGALNGTVRFQRSF